MKTLEEYVASAKIPPIADFHRLDNEFSEPGYGKKLWDAVNLGWTPGKEGKGLLADNGELYTWSTWNDLGDPHHGEVCDVLGEVGITTYRPYLIEAIYPDGKFESWAKYQNKIESVQKQDPRLKPSGDDEPWRLAAHGMMTNADILALVTKGWQPGTIGKAIDANDGEHYTWSVNKIGSPHHIEVIQAIPGIRSTKQWNISVTGEFTSWEDMAGQDLDDDGWDFTSKIASADWEEGQDGKGVIDTLGEVHTWNTDDYEYHGDWMKAYDTPPEKISHYLYIDPNGRVHRSGISKALKPHEIEALKKKDPRLHVAGPADWSFG